MSLYITPHQEATQLPQTLYVPAADYVPVSDYVPTGAEGELKVYGFIPESVYGPVRLAGAASGAYHGFKRNNSIGWAVGWALLGGLLPIITIPLSLAQGFGKPKR